MGEKKKAFPLLSVSCRIVDMSSCLLQLSGLPFDMGHSITKCVFCGRWVQVFGNLPCLSVSYQSSLPTCPCPRGDLHRFLQPDSAEPVQPEPWHLHTGKAGRGRLTTAPTADWPLKKIHMVLAQGCLLHAGKYLQAKAPDDLNMLCQSTSLHSLIHSESVNLSPILLPSTVPCRIRGVSQAELRGAGTAHCAVACKQTLPVACSLTPQVLLWECEAVRYDTTC